MPSRDGGSPEVPWRRGRAGESRNRTLLARARRDLHSAPSATLAGILETAACHSKTTVARALEVTAALVRVARHAVALLQDHAEIGAGRHRLQRASAFERAHRARNIAVTAGSEEMDPGEPDAAIGPALPTGAFVELR